LCRQRRIRSAVTGLDQKALPPLPISHGSAITPPSRRPAKGCRGGGEVLNQHAQFEHQSGNRGAYPSLPAEESQMPKMKSKSGAKKRFKITGTGKVISAHAGKR